MTLLELLRQELPKRGGWPEGEGCNFRPLRTEADKKRDAAIEAIDWYMPECILDTPNEFGHAKKIYDAIAAGKIPGVKLEV